jgi:3'(2'), 5'-bisphosphate nucleotidase
MTYEKELGIALEAAHLAGEIILKHYMTFIAIPDAKADMSTQDDRDSQETILQHILKAFPEDSFCAEENTPTLASANRTGSRLWIVDPIDGTRGFAKKNGEFSVMIGFLDQKLIRVGVVLEPATGRLTFAKQGGGCWRQDNKGSKPIACRVLPTKLLCEATLTQSHARKPGRQLTLVKSLEPGKVIETYSAGIKLAQVARGEADLYLNTYLNFHDWDVCAGHILVEEAGGKVTGLNDEPILYAVNQASQRTGLLASNTLLHQQALDVISKVDLSGESQ